uniref:Uncharacterized protein n=1 Tax=Romanomermis culicivorax TaxID=13658 RepID=A0A915HFE6_ROMCU
MGVTGIIMAIETNGTGVAKIAAVISGVASTGRRVPPGRKIVPMQQGHGTVGFAMVLKIDSLNVGDFRGSLKWGILRIGHPAID